MDSGAFSFDGAPAPAGVSVAGLGDLSGDSDGDGLSDGDEIFRYDTDPNVTDTDGDGISDAAEVLAGANPLNADESGGSILSGIDETAVTFSNGVTRALVGTNAVPFAPFSLASAVPTVVSRSTNEVWSWSASNTLYKTGVETNAVPYSGIKEAIE